MSRRWTLAALLAATALAVWLFVTHDDEAAMQHAADGARSAPDGGALTGRGGGRTPSDSAEEDEELVFEGAGQEPLIDREDSVPVRGRIVDPYGVGVAYAHINIEGVERAWRSSMSTGADGSFEKAVPRGAFPLELVPGIRRRRREELTTYVKVDSGDVTINWPAERMLEGRVIDERGEPVPDVRVEVRGGEMRTRRDGTFRLWLWLDTKGLTLTVSPTSQMRDRGFVRAQVADVAGGGAPTEVVLVRHQGLFGRVVSADGASVWGYTIYAQLESEADRVLTEGDDVAAKPAVWDKTNEKGRFALAPLEPGRYLVTVSRPHSFGMFDQHVVDAPAGEAEIRLRPRAQLSGRLDLDDPSGWRLEYVPVDARGPRHLINRYERLFTNGAFQFSIPGWSRGIVRAFRVDDDRYALQHVAAGSHSGVKLVVQEGRTLAGRVLGVPADDGGFTGFVSATQGRVVLSIRAKKDGTFRFRGVPPGEWSLRAVAWRSSNPKQRHRGTAIAQAGDELVQLRVDPVR